MKLKPTTLTAAFWTKQTQSRGILPGCVHAEEFGRKIERLCFPNWNHYVSRTTHSIVQTAPQGAACDMVSVEASVSRVHVAGVTDWPPDPLTPVWHFLKWGKADSCKGCREVESGKVEKGAFTLAFVSCVTETQRPKYYLSFPRNCIAVKSLSRPCELEWENCRSYLRPLTSWAFRNSKLLPSSIVIERAPRA